MRVALPFLALAFVGALATPAKDQKDADWESFKVEYNKRYSSVTEEALRKKIFLKNQEEILRHNEDFEKGLTTYTMRINQFSDLLPSEIEESRPPMMARKDNDWFAQLGIVKLFQSPTSDDDDVPDSIDWRLEGAVTPPKNQHTCGACWAFSATGGLEGQLYLKTGKLESLSEQNLIDCAKEANGCKGGSLPHAYQYVKKHGIRTEASYPYRNKRGECRENDTIAEVRIKQFLHVSAGDENDLKAAVGTAGPVPVCIDARPSFNNYHRGVYHEKHCNTTVTNHCVLVVGYGTTEVGQDYWIVKNSWGPHQWGEGGYIRMARNMNNMCAIATFGYLPLISDD